MKKNLLNTLHPLARSILHDHHVGCIDRRECLAQFTSLGVSSALAYQLLGVKPSLAQTQASDHNQIRIAMSIKSLIDPRLFDWPEMAWFPSGWLEYLVEYNSDGSFQPFLLEGWETNDDATQYVLNVRKNVLWNDGSRFTAEDVLFNLERWCDRSIQGNSMASRMSALIDPSTNKLQAEAAELLDDYKIKLTLNAPDITLIAGMSDYPALIVPRDFDAENMLKDPKGTGPWIPNGKFELGHSATLIKNENHEWWGARALSYSILERIEFRDFGTDFYAWISAAENDECDMFYETSADFVEQANTVGWTESSVATGATLVIRANQKVESEQGDKVYDNRSVRLAISMAVDNDLLLELGYSGRGLKAENCHVGPIHPSYDGNSTRILSDPAGARQLLEAEGYENHLFEVTCSDESFHAQTCAAMVALLQEAGFKAQLHVVSSEEYWKNWMTYPLSATAWNHRPLGVQVLNLAYHSKAVWNETGFSNSKFDHLLNQANGIADPKERRDVMGQLQKILIDEGVITQPYWRSLFRHHKNDVQGAEINIALLPQLYKISRVELQT